MTQQAYLLNLGSHSFFQILYTLLLSLRIFILLRSSFFSSLSFSDSGCVFRSSPTLTSVLILVITVQALLSDTILPSHFLPFHFYVLYMFSLATFYLEIFLHHSWIKLFKSFTINNLNEKRTFNKNSDHWLWKWSIKNNTEID